MKLNFTTSTQFRLLSPYKASTRLHESDDASGITPILEDAKCKNEQPIPTSILQLHPLEQLNLTRPRQRDDLTTREKNEVLQRIVADDLDRCRLQDCDFRSTGGRVEGGSRGGLGEGDVGLRMCLRERVEGAMFA